MFKLGLEKAEEPKIKFPASIGSLKKQRSSRKTSISALLTMPKPLTVWITINCGKFWKRWEYQTTWPASREICMQVKKQQLELDMEQQTGSKLGKEYVKAVQFSRSVVSDFLRPHGLLPSRLLCPWDFPGKSTGVGCHCLLCQQPLDHGKSKWVPEKDLLLLYWLCQSLWLCGSQQTVENSERDGNTRPPYLPPEKTVCRSRGNS